MKKTYKHKGTVYTKKGESELSAIQTRTVTKKSIEANLLEVQHNIEAMQKAVLKAKEVETFWEELYKLITE